MYVKKLVIQNIKSFRETTEFRFNRGLNFIAGDNNCGKSTVFEAITFLAGGKFEPSALFSTNSESSSRVELTLAGAPLRSRIETDKFKKLIEYLHIDDDGDEILRVQRSHEEREVTQNDKKVRLDVKKLCFWHPGHGQYENATGIDALFKALIDFEAIWADTVPSDTADFGGDKNIGQTACCGDTPLLCDGTMGCLHSSS